MTSSACRLLVFEPDFRENFYPLTYTKPSFDLLFGTETLLEAIERKLKIKATNLYTPRYIEDYAKELHPSVEVNQSVSTECVIVNSLVSHRRELWDFMRNALNELTGDWIFVDSNGALTFGRLSECDPGLLSDKRSPRKKNLSTSISGMQIRKLPLELEGSALIHHPWELVRHNSAKISLDFLEKKNSTTFSRDSSPATGDLEIKGNRVSIAENAQMDRFVTLDSSAGPVVIDERAEVESFSRISGPAYIGKGAKVRSARVREGTSIGEHTKIAGEVDTTIVSSFSNKSHDGFLGHSIVGSWVNLGALTSNSDLKNTYGKIAVSLGRKTFDTGEIKVGAFFGDMAKSAIGTLIGSGRRIGTGSQVFGFVSEDVPSFTMYGKSLKAQSSEVIIESALQTQKRMMERRGRVLSDTYASLIRSVYKMTKGERAIQRVSKARFRLP